VNTKRIIQKMVFITLTLAACSGLVVLLVAAIGKKNHENCKDYIITVKGAKHHLFIDESDIKKLLTAAVKGKIKGDRMSDFNLRKLEQAIRASAWVQKATLYFDNRDVLHISVTQKEPIARIFTTTSKSFYIDSTMKQMPLSGKMSARVPVFTNFPDKKFLSDKDSILLVDVKKTALFILNDSFWMSQTEQIDITKDRCFELVPTVGNHIVKLGDGDDIDKKFQRLFIFYQQVMSKAGFNRYNIVDVRYEGQVTGTKEKISKIDSAQLRKNVEKLLKEARDMQQDTVAMTPSTNKQTTTLQQVTKAEAVDVTQVASNPLKATSNAKPKLIVKDAEDKKPKAVMAEKN
jgi:cell division protein FtsQ